MTLTPQKTVTALCKVSVKVMMTTFDAQTRNQGQANKQWFKYRVIQNA
jgi:hypothetical protein